MRRKVIVREWLAVIGLAVILGYVFIGTKLIKDLTDSPSLISYDNLSAVVLSTPPDGLSFKLRTTDITEFYNSARENGFTKNGGFNFGLLWKFMISVGDSDGDCQLSTSEFKNTLKNNLGITDNDAIDTIVSKIGLKKGIFQRTEPKLSEKMYKEFIAGLPNRGDVKVFLPNDIKDQLKAIIQSDAEYLYSKVNSSCSPLLRVIAYEAVTSSRGKVSYSNISEGEVIVTRLPSRTRREALIFKGSITNPSGILLTDLTEGTYKVDFKPTDDFKGSSNFVTKNVTLTGHKLSAVSFEVERHTSVVISVFQADSINREYIPGVQVSIDYKDGRGRVKNKTAVTGSDGKVTLVDSDAGVTGLLEFQTLTITAKKSGLKILGATTDTFQRQIGYGENSIRIDMIKTEKPVPSPTDTTTPTPTDTYTPTPTDTYYPTYSPTYSPAPTSGWQ